MKVKSVFFPYRNMYEMLLQELWSQTRKPTGLVGKGGTPSTLFLDSPLSCFFVNLN